MGLQLLVRLLPHPYVAHPASIRHPSQGPTGPRQYSTDFVVLQLVTLIMVNDARLQFGEVGVDDGLVLNAEEEVGWLGAAQAVTAACRTSEDSVVRGTRRPVHTPLPRR